MPCVSTGKGRCPCELKCTSADSYSAAPASFPLTLRQAQRQFSDSQLEGVARHMAAVPSPRSPSSFPCQATVSGVGIRQCLFEIPNAQHIQSVHKFESQQAVRLNLVTVICWALQTPCAQRPLPAGLWQNMKAQ